MNSPRMPGKAESLLHQIYWQVRWEKQGVAEGEFVQGKGGGDSGSPIISALSIRAVQAEFLSNLAAAPQCNTGLRA